MTFIISKIAPDEESNKVQMLKEVFYSTNPLGAIFDLHKDGDDEPTAPPPDLRSPQDFNIKAEDSKGQIIGLAINKSCIPKVSTPEPEEDNVIYKFFSFLEVDAKLEELPEKTMELSILIVGEEWRRQGVAKMLVEESMRVSRQAGFQAMRVCCTLHQRVLSKDSQGFGLEGALPASLPGLPTTLWHKCFGQNSPNTQTYLLLLD